MTKESRSRSVRHSYIILVCVVLMSCGLQQSKQDSEKIIARHFRAISTGDFDGVLADYSSRFYAKMPKEEWRKSLADLKQKLGDYQSYSIAGWNLNRSTSTAGAGTFVNFECHVAYSRYPAVEKFTLFKGTDDVDFKIVAHVINSNGLLRE